MGFTRVLAGAAGLFALALVNPVHGQLFACGPGAVSQSSGSCTCAATGYTTDSSSWRGTQVNSWQYYTVITCKEASSCMPPSTWASTTCGNCPSGYASSQVGGVWCQQTVTNTGIECIWPATADNTNGACVCPSDSNTYTQVGLLQDLAVVCTLPSNGNNANPWGLGGMILRLRSVALCSAFRVHDRSTARSIISSQRIGRMSLWLWNICAWRPITTYAHCTAHLASNSVECTPINWCTDPTICPRDWAHSSSSLSPPHANQAPARPPVLPASTRTALHALV